MNDTSLIFFVTAKQACVEHNTDAPVVAVKFGERGYYPIYTKLTAEELNASRAQYTPEELESAVIGSMFGWTVPGARAARAAFEKREEQAARALGGRV